jgi:SAM-dependent methyltransferase
MTVELPPGADVGEWVRRWDRMQERFLVAREERFAELARLVRAAVASPRRVVDLGCGTGSVAAHLLEAIPEVEVVGVDVDPTLLALARGRCRGFGARARFLEADLRKPGWAAALEVPVDAAVSATALHWLSAAELASVYGLLARRLSPGGIFLNADHVATSIRGVQADWEAARSAELEAWSWRGEGWAAFWEGYLALLGPEARAVREAALGDLRGVEEGLPLAWHLDALRQAGFTGVDCFWRCDCDAIYGGVVPA